MAIFSLAGAVGSAVVSAVVKALLTKRMIIKLMIHLVDHFVKKSDTNTDDVVWADFRKALEKEIA